MLKHVLFAVFLLSIFSCNHELTKEETCEKLDLSLRKHLEDLAFKGNYPCTIYELKTVDFEEVSDNYLDSMRLTTNYQDYEDYKSLLESTIELAQTESSQANLYLETFGKGSLSDISREDAQKHINEATQYKDSLVAIIKRDSVIKARIALRKHTERKYFKTKTFLKATLGDHNKLDTVNYIFTKDFKPVIN
ncbi:hypothetical protein [Siphonobacter sp. SORGH_AS_1065]|uniref:hypothetical protein n=1 Tax=Siphonobacter sp. SORGH_AS_1065 TaxID=3041795 RepID=UPI00277FF9F4|nr:hypothetical protein [Siphonobacter sp. SORGH_AS_1065]MDQ1089037.1 hypothetical protein [Siphonobacter sp. SORGH_AS_1065]